MKASRIAVIVSLVFAASLSLHGKKQEPVQHAPLPAKLLAAKSIYIQNDSGQADMADKAYTELKTWGRYQIVDAKDKADVILVLSVTTEETRKTSVSHSSSYNYQTGAWTHGTTTVPDRMTWRFSRVALLDPGTGKVEWSDHLVQRRKYSATEELIKELRRRIEEQEKDFTRSK